MDTPAEVTRENGPPAGLPSRKRLWLAALALALVTFALFSPLLGAHFINYDDQGYVTDNPHVLHGLTWADVHWAWTHLYFGFYYPLTLMSHQLDCQLYGLWAGGHHLTNLLFHIGSALLLFAFFWKTTRAFWRSLAVALLFAIHPLHVESVAWISERKDVLSTFFLMAMLVAYADYARAPSFRRYLAVFGAFLLGLLSKSMIVTAPFLLLLLDYWPLRRFSLGGLTVEAPREEGIPSAAPRLDPRLGWRLVAEKLPLLGLSVLFSVLTFLAQSHAGAIGGPPLRFRAINAISSYGAYLSKALFPVNLALFYPLRLESIHWEQGALGGLLLIAVFLFGWLRRHSNPYLLVGWLWYVGMLVPVLGFIQIGSMAMADRYTYVPLVGVFILLAWGVHDIWEHIEGPKIRGALLVLSGIWLLFLMITTYRQSHYWHDSLAIWRHSLLVTQHNDTASNSYGRALMKRGYYREAEIYFKQALAWNPAHFPAWVNLFMVADLQGQNRLAEGALKEAARLRPTNIAVHLDLAKFYQRAGHKEEARKEWLRVLALDPSNQVARRASSKAQAPESE